MTKRNALVIGHGSVGPIWAKRDKEYNHPNAHNPFKIQIFL